MLAPEFYETEALRGEWPLRQLERQINSQFCERTALSKEKAAMLTKGQRALPKDAVRPKEEIKDPFVLKFLDPKDDYFENTLEEALNRPMETFLLKLGGNFCFVGGQRRLIIGKERYRMDHLFFHRRLRSLVGIDLKIGRFTHAAAGQMHFYFNYARKRWVHDEENPLLVLILCAQKVEANARYAPRKAAELGDASRAWNHHTRQESPVIGSRPHEGGAGCPRLVTLEEGEVRADDAKWQHQERQAQER